MDLSQSLSGATHNPTEHLLVTDVVYEVESTGHRHDTPIVHLRCRRPDGTLRIVEVEGFRPYFYIRHATFAEEPFAVLNDRRVLGVEGRFESDAYAEREDLDVDTGDAPLTVRDELDERGSAHVTHTDDPTQSLYDEDLVRIVCTEPGAVGGSDGFRDYFEQTFEADVPFTRRFQISTGIKRGVKVPTGAQRVRHENWTGESDGPSQVQELEACEPPTQQARVCTVDIEVAVHGGGFPEPHRARNEITAIGAHDSYRDEYRLWGLTHPDWEADVDDLESMCSSVVDGADEEFSLEVREEHVHFFDDETALLESFHDWYLECAPDLITGWNSSGFDVPYLIQRSYAVNALQIRDWPMIGKPATWPEEHDGDTHTRYKLKGVCTLDMLDAYKKTQFRNLSSYKLDAVAEAELGRGKIDLAGDELDEAWSDSPIEFFVYNLRDVEAVVEIERTCALMSLYENLRRVTGASYETCNHNGPMIDSLFLSLAFDQGLALPTNEEPDQGDYFGAHVFDPVPGVHRNVVYPDLASLYPFIAWTLNLSPETIYDSVEDARDDGYSENDLFTAYIDRRGFATVAKGDSIDHLDRAEYKGVKTDDGGLREMFEPRFDTVYYLKPSVREGFIRSAIDLLVDLKYQYKGDPQMYGAVKRVTNSVYGVLGDSASGGVGFRLFDWRLAETITLAGQKVIRFTANKYVDTIGELATQDGYDVDVYQVGGDTDSVQTAVDGAPDYLTALEWAQVASERFLGTPDDPGYYDEYMDREFDVRIGEDEHRMDVEIESLASALFFMRDQDADDPETTAVKKRYAQHMVWDDDDGWLDTPDAEEYPGDALADDADLSELKHQASVTYEDYGEEGVLTHQDPQGNIGIKGFEYVRSDSAQITRDVQMRVLSDLLLTDSPRERIEPYLRELRDDVLAGEVDLERLARPKGISQELDNYGWKEIDELDDEDITPEVEAWGGAYVATPGPAYRGAKYSDDHFPWEELGAGSKPKKIPIETVRSDDYPAVYDYITYPKADRPDSPEVGREVDAIAVEHTGRVPDGFVVDYEKICLKAVEDKVDPILQTLDLSWDELMAIGAQSSLTDW